MRALVTGAYGFIGKHLVQALRASGAHVDCFGSGDGQAALTAYCRKADVVFHLAGVNRASDAALLQGNVAAAEQLTEALTQVGNPCPVIVTSSVQASLQGRYDNAYGRSKLQSEQVLFRYAAQSGANVTVLRLPGVFGKWCRPNYNSVVATFCHAIARGEPIAVCEEERELELLYIDDVIDTLLLSASLTGKSGFAALPTPYRIRVGELAARIESFYALQTSGVLPRLAPGSAEARLYATYLSYLPPEQLLLPLARHNDERGSFFELLRSDAGGQISVNVTLPGQTRGQHWHNSKWEIFFVVGGRGEIRLRRVGDSEVIRFALDAASPTAVRIPPGYVHALVNTAEDTALTTVIWASEYFDAARPDTFREDI